MVENSAHIPSRRRRRSNCPISAGAGQVRVVPSPPYSLEPEVEEDRRIQTIWTSGISSGGRRDAIRSTIYSGFRRRRTAMKKNFEKRRHSPLRRSMMESPSGGLSGSLLESSHPPAYTRQTTSCIRNHSQVTTKQACRSNHRRTILSPGL